MQDAVRDVGRVLDWMQGTRQLLENDDPRVKALAVQKLQLRTDAEWEATRQKLLQQLDGSIQIAQSHATETIKAGSPPQARPFVPANRFGAVFQSAMEEHLNDRKTSAIQATAAAAPMPYGQPEKFDSGDIGWVVVLFARLEEGVQGRHIFIHHSNVSNFRYDLPAQTNVGLFADWATGEPPALSIKAAIENRSPDYTIHLGDTYYAGFEDEISHNLIACWPGGVQYEKSFALNGNHEMYSGGNAYFELIPMFGQAASYFNLGNQYWRLIALDTSWCERGGDTPASSWGELVDVEIEWLRAQIQHAQSFNPPAQVILLTHHQLFSAFDGTDLGQVLLGQLKPFLDAGNIYAWFWGHEHRAIVYAPNATYNFKARCIGHGGFPYPPSNDSPAHVAAFPIAWREQRGEPNDASYGMRGFALLSFAGPSVKIDYIDQTGASVYSEQW
jgi:Calcineurin-like phosphoesterase